MDIDTTGFEQGMPSRLEMLEHQYHMLCSENDELRRDLALARRNIEKLVDINQDLNQQIQAERIRANGAYVDFVNLMNWARCSFGIDLARDDQEREHTQRLKHLLARATAAKTTDLDPQVTNS